MISHVGSKVGGNFERISGKAPAVVTLTETTFGIQECAFCRRKVLNNCVWHMYRFVAFSEIVPLSYLNLHLGAEELHLLREKCPILSVMLLALSSLTWVLCCSHVNIPKIFSLNINQCLIPGVGLM
jgi:hypothetical protein